MPGPLVLALLPVLLGCLHVTWGQAFHMGKCPDPPAQEEFDVSKVGGTPGGGHHLLSMHKGEVRVYRPTGAGGGGFKTLTGTALLWRREATLLSLPSRHVQNSNLLFFSLVSGEMVCD